MPVRDMSGGAPKGIVVPNRLVVILALASGLLAAVSSPASSQDAQPSAPSFNLLIQTQAQLAEDPPSSSPNGIRARRVRPRWRGKALTDLSYDVQAELVNDFPLLDARVVWAAGSTTNLHLGLFKSPFSLELLEAIHASDLINRSRTVVALAPARQVGVMIEQTVAANLVVQAGGFNGNGGSTFVNENNELLWAGRVVFNRSTDLWRVQFGVNGFTSHDSALRFRGFYDSFTGTRSGAGADMWVRFGSWTVKAELLIVDFDPDGPKDRQSAAAPSYQPRGGYLTAYYDLADIHRIIVRLDRYDPDTGSGNTDDLLFGYVWEPQTRFRLSLNVIQPLEQERASSPTVLGQVQVRI